MTHPHGHRHGVITDADKAHAVEVMTEEQITKLETAALRCLDSGDGYKHVPVAPYELLGLVLLARRK